jgi:hypothetical protein
MSPREPCNVAWVRRARQSSPASQSAPGDSSRAGACCNKWNDKKRAVGVGAIFNLMTIPPSSTLTSSRMAPFATTSLPSIPSDKGVHERRGPSVSRLFPEERRFRENCSHPLAPPNLTHSPATARSPPGGSNITVTRRLPHDGHLRHASRRERGKSRPRVHTSVSRSRALRYLHSRIDFNPSRRPQAQRMWMRHPAAFATPIVSTAVMGTK